MVAGNETDLLWITQLGNPVSGDVNLGRKCGKGNITGYTKVIRINLLKVYLQGIKNCHLMFGFPLTVPGNLTQQPLTCHLPHA